MSALSTALAVTACNRESRAASGDTGWRGYNNSHDGQRFSALDQIDTGNVARLKPVCELKLGEEGPFQTGPVVIGDTMFLTTAHTTVAKDLASIVACVRSPKPPMPDPHPSPLDDAAVTAVSEYARTLQGTPER
jgi:hypothetical protein